MKTTFRYIFATLAIAAVGAVAYSAIRAADPASTERVTLADQQFDIPRRYVDALGGGMPWWLKYLPGLDVSSSDINLEIGPHEMTKAVPGYKPFDENYPENLLMRMVVLSEVDRQRYLDTAGKFTDIWNATGQYQNEIIERDPATGYYKVFREVDYPRSWETFTISPKTTPLPQDIFSFWVGGCLKSKGSPLTKSGILVDCQSFAMVDNVAVNFHVSWQNIKLLPQIRAFLVQQMQAWQASAAGKK